MESNTLIRKVHMSCPLCNKAHEIEEKENYEYYIKRRGSNL